MGLSLTSTRHGVFAALILGCAVALIAGEADACDSSSPQAHELDPDEQAVDTTAPSGVEGSSHSIKRGRGPERDGCSESASSCDDIGTVALYLGDATDDRTDPGSLGYRLEVVGGRAPSGLSWPSGPVRPGEDKVVYLSWVDGSDDDQEPVDFTIQIRAVDLAGNEGPPEELRLRHAGSDEGCGVSGRSIDVSWLFMLPALLLLGGARRRREA